MAVGWGVRRRRNILLRATFCLISQFTSTLASAVTRQDPVLTIKHDTTAEGTILVIGRLELIEREVLDGGLDVSVGNDLQRVDDTK